MGSALATENSALNIRGTVISAEPIHRDDGGKKVFSCVLEGDQADTSNRLGPNRIRMVCRGEWADGCSFISSGDKVTVDRFKVEESGDPERPFDAVVGDTSEVTVVRNRVIRLTAQTVGTFDFKIDNTQQARHTCRVLQGHNQFARCGQYYDVIRGSGQAANRRAQFISDVVSQAVRKNILDVACGSGIYTFTLRYFGFAVTAFDTSEQQLEAARAKLSFHQDTSPQKQEPRILRADMCKFAIRAGTEKAEGSVLPLEGLEQFDCCLLIDALQLLPNMRRVRDCIRRVWYHLELGGLLLCDIPNATVASENQTQSSFHFEICAGERALGAAILDPGTLDIVERQHNKAGGVRVTEWHGFAAQTRREQRARYYTNFDESFEEIQINPPEFEEILDEEGFEVVALYGDVEGNPYDSRESKRRFYVLRRREMQARPPPAEDDSESDDG
eukprot:Hpha_TRINITY_DN10822_c0_g1::TRINITY_DN10822_c0_g1_i1::g.23285::m.23285